MTISTEHIKQINLLLPFFESSLNESFARVSKDNVFKESVKSEECLEILLWFYEKSRGDNGQDSEKGRVLQLI